MIAVYMPCCWGQSPSMCAHFQSRVYTTAVAKQERRGTYSRDPGDCVCSPTLANTREVVFICLSSVPPITWCSGRYHPHAKFECLIMRTSAYGVLETPPALCLAICGRESCTNANIRLKAQRRTMCKLHNPRSTWKNA